MSVPLEVDEQNGIEYCVLQQEHFDGVVKVVAEAFSKYEPLGIACSLSVNDMSGFVSLLVKRMVGEGLTIVALNAKTKEVLGARLCEDFAAPDQAGLDEYMSSGKLEGSFEPVMAILKKADEPFYEKEGLPFPDSDKTKV